LGCVVFSLSFRFQQSDTALRPRKSQFGVAAMEEHQETGNWIDVYNQGKEQ
jgi:hypothetical protein